MQRGTKYDAIVVGIGGLGSSALYHLARRGKSVLGIDRFSPPHDRGSSHGHTRIYRQAYYEAPEYVPLALRALELWQALEREVGQRLFASTGALTIGPESGELFSGALRSAREHGIAHEILTTAEAQRRFPAFRSPPDTAALFEPTGGVLFVEACVRAHLSLAARHGAAIHTDEEVTRVEQHGDAVAITTSRGVYEAERVIVAAGAWAPRLMRFQPAVRVTREMVHWFSPVSRSAAAPACPVSMIDYGAGPILYTLPDFGDGFKAGLHHGGNEVKEPAENEAVVRITDVDVVASRVAQFAPGGAGALRTSAPCYYTTTRDHHFAIGALPAAPAVILASACSGHGFKFASVLGESVAALASGEATALPRSLFDVARL